MIGYATALTLTYIRGWCSSSITFTCILSWCCVPVSTVRVSYQIPQICYNTLWHLKQISCYSFKVSRILPTFMLHFFQSLCHHSNSNVCHRPQLSMHTAGLEGQPHIHTNTCTYIMWDTYWCIQVALTVHGQIEFGLHPLDSHHSQAHWNKVEHGWKKTESRNKG